MNRGSSVLIDWLSTEGPNQSSLGSLIRLYCQKLLKAGVPVDRAFLGTLMIHPQAAAYTFFYEAESDDLRELEISHEQYQILDTQKGTPMSHMLETATPLRAQLRLGEDHHMADLSALSEQGYTDYLALPIRIGDTVKAGMGWATRSPSGFTEEDIQTLTEAHPTFSILSFIYVQRRIQGSLLAAYLGGDAAQEVQNGVVQLGAGTQITAAFLFCDIRRFSVLSNEHPLPDVLGLLNSVFEIIVRAVETADGQVLKFIGDGVLATFDERGDDNRHPCQRALDAALRVQDALAAARRDNRSANMDSAHVGIGIHYGTAMYGNIGAPGRLDFTVIGPAVNLTARLEALCGQLDAEILVSKDVSENVREVCCSRGVHAIKGFSHPVEVFTPTGPTKENSVSD